MVDLEERAVRRDKGFVVRLVVLLLCGAVVGAIVYAELTSTAVGGCAAHTFGGATSTGAADSGAGGRASPGR